MLFWTAILSGSIGLLILVFIQEFFYGDPGLIAPILTGVYLVIGVMCAIQSHILASVLCFLPMIELTVAELLWKRCPDE